MRHYCSPTSSAEMRSISREAQSAPEPRLLVSDLCVMTELAPASSSSDIPSSPRPGGADELVPGHLLSLWKRSLGVMSRDVVESVEGCAANRRVVSVVVVEVEPAGQRQASFGL